MESFPKLDGFAEQYIQSRARQLARRREFQGEEASDIAQELALYLWRRLPHYDARRGREQKPDAKHDSDNRGRL